MKGKHLLPLLASIILILVLVATSCTPTTTTPKQTTTKPGATTSQPQSKDTIYRVLNPVGIDQPVDLSPLAKRIDGLAGKTIAVSMAEGSPMVMPTLYERVKKEFPTSTIVYRESRTTGPTRLTDEELKPIQALIQGNAWWIGATNGQVGYCAYVEKKGIPTVQILFEDQIEYSKRVSIRNGSQYIRPVVAPRVGSGEERVNFLWNNMIKALTTPLTAAEQEKGRYEPAPPPRIAYEGTLLDAQNFFNQSTPIAACGDCAIAKYTDGLPIVIPTEAAVKAMLAGTSHSPDEVVYRYSMNATTKQVQKAATPLSFAGYLATVEKVAVNAVMSGCKPEYLPVVLAIATSGLGVGTDPIWSQWQVVSGPYAKEIGMNSMVGAMEPGNVANRPIARSYQIMTINLAGSLVGVNRMNAMGWPGNGAACFAENDAGLPPGWETLREESGYKKTDSIVMTWNTITNVYVQDEIYGSFYRGFQDRAPNVEWPQGSEALQLKVKRGIDIVGKQGPHNFLEVPVDHWWESMWGSKTLIFIPRIADDLYRYGFKSKAAIYKWIWDSSFVPFSERQYLGVRGVVGPTDGYTGKKWADIPLDTPYPRVAGIYGTGKADSSLVLVAGGTYEEWIRLDTGRGTAYPIDPWR